MTNLPENIIVEARDVSFSYPEEPDRHVLNNLNLQVCRGECVAILGESGAGKTTLLKLLCGLLQPSQGQILFEGKPLQGPRNDIALIFQNYGLFPWKTVRENILLPAAIYESSGPRDFAEEWIETLNIHHLKEVRAAELSGGELRRTAIARTLCMQPPVILADEPTGDLDDENTKLVFRCFRKAAEKNAAVPIVSHETDALKFADHAFRMDGGVVTELM